jgi:ABC-type Fe3+-hydroxamate transport system substrate-binding protein
MALLLAAGAVVLLLIGGAVGYLLGHQGATESAARVGPAAQGFGLGGFGPGGFHGHGRGGRGAAGTIDSVNGSTITLTTRNGRKVTVTAAPDVVVTVRSQGTVADLKAGQTIVVAGRVGNDGTITASRIAVGPASR